MRNRPALRAAVACAALCTVGAFGASAAGASEPGSAKPAAPAFSLSFSARKGPIPRVRTNTSPELTMVVFPGAVGLRQMLVYKGYRTNDGLYYTLSNLDGTTPWSRPKQIDAAAHAASTHRPSAAYYPSGSGDYVIVVWLGSAGSIWYSIGAATTAGTLVWSHETRIPGATTSDSPTVYKEFYANALLLTWKARTSNAIRYMILTPAGGSIDLGPVQTLPGGALIPGTALTSDPPTVAGLTITYASAADVYMFWRGATNGRIWYEQTPNPTATASPSWSPKVELPSGLLTSNSPQAQPVGAGRSGPIVVSYCGKTTGNVFYALLQTTSQVGPPKKVPSLKCGTLAPGLDLEMIAATNPSSGRVYYNLLEQNLN